MDSEETLLKFAYKGTTYELDHLGINDDTQWGQFAIYTGDRQVGSFAIGDSVHLPRTAALLASSAELIKLAQAVLLDGGDTRLDHDNAVDATTAANPTDLASGGGAHGESVEAQSRCQHIASQHCDRPDRHALGVRWDSVSLALRVRVAADLRALADATEPPPTHRRDARRSRRDDK